MGVLIKGLDSDKPELGLGAAAADVVRAEFDRVWKIFIDTKAPFTPENLQRVVEAATTHSGEALAQLLRDKPTAKRIGAIFTFIVYTPRYFFVAQTGDGAVFFQEGAGFPVINTDSRAFKKSIRVQRWSPLRGVSIYADEPVMYLGYPSDTFRMILVASPRANLKAIGMATAWYADNPEREVAAVASSLPPTVDDLTLLAIYPPAKNEHQASDPSSNTAPHNGIPDPMSKGLLDRYLFRPELQAIPLLVGLGSYGYLVSRTFRDVVTSTGLWYAGINAALSLVLWGVAIIGLELYSNRSSLRPEKRSARWRLLHEDARIRNRVILFALPGLFQVIVVKLGLVFQKIASAIPSELMASFSRFVRPALWTFAVMVAWIYRHRLYEVGRYLRSIKSIRSALQAA